MLSTDFTRARNSISDAQNKLLLVGSGEVVKNLMIFHDAIKPSSKDLSGDKHDLLLTELLKSMRRDLYGNKKINKYYPIVHLTGIARYGKAGGQSNE